MAPLKTLKVAAALRKKGFVVDQGDHTFYTLYIDGKKTKIFTKISHNNPEISDGLISCMHKQCRISKDEFVKLVSCFLSYEGYIDVLIKRGHIKPKEPSLPD